MEAGPATRRRAADPRLARVRRRLLTPGVLVPVALVLVVYAAALRPAITSPLVAAGAAGLLVLVCLVGAVGLDRASNALLVVAFGLAPLAGLSLGSQFISAATLVFALSVALALPRMIHVPLRLPAAFVVGGAMLTVTGLVATAVASSPIVSGSYWLTVVVALVAIPAVVVWMAPGPRLIYACAVAFGIGTAISTFYGFPYDYRNYGLTYHPVALAYTAMLTLSLIPYLVAMRVRGTWLVVPPITLVALVAVWTSGSRTSLVVLAALVVLVPVFERSIRLGLVAAASIVVVLPLVFSFEAATGSTSALSRLFGTGGARASDDVRMQTFRDGWEKIQQSPLFGNGFSVDTHVIHNLYLQILEAEGILGLVGLLLMLGAMLTPLRKATAPQRCLAYPVVAVILAGPFQPNMSDHYLGLCLGLALTAAVGVMKPRPATDVPANVAESAARRLPAG